LGEKKRKIRKIVLDTNVFISALLFEGEASKLVNLWKQGQVVPLVSAETLTEIARVLACPKFDLENREIKSLINEDILPYVETVKIIRPIECVCPDPGDDIFLACAVNGKAEAVISGDRHLLSLKEFEGIPILKIADLLGGI
jgi:uncharacterized protein